MRLFIAIMINEEVTAYLKELQKKFLGLGYFNFVNGFHLTLKFLGDVDDDKIEKIDELLKKVRHRKFKLCLNSLGVFPSPRNARVLYVGVSGNIGDLWNKIEMKLKNEFGSREEFKEHITLARVKNIIDKEKFSHSLKYDVEKLCFEVENFKLIKSELKSDGPVYTDLKQYKLF